MASIKRKFLLCGMLGFFLVLLIILQLRCDLFAQVFPKNPQLDPSKPVPTKDEIIKAWRKRQDAIKTFRFAWTEQQTHPKGWLPNPRYAQREWSNIPSLLKDRNYTVNKALAVDGGKMRYSFEIYRKEETDALAQGDNKGLGAGRHYSYVSVFDGQTAKTSLNSITNFNSEPNAASQASTSVDAQNLDTRAIMMTLRPLDSAMGHILLDRAVTNLRRTFYKDKSTFLLEERHDPSGWKMILRIEPERDFTVCEYLVIFEQKLIADIDIDYIEDAKYGWIPSGWQVSQMLDDGSIRLLSEAKVTSYSINQPIGAEEFK
jgi:hypothetical protein